MVLKHSSCLVLLAALSLPALLNPLLLIRLGRNAFTPAMPRSIEPRFPLVDERTLAAEVTVVVGTKDTITPTSTQLRHHIS